MSLIYDNLRALQAQTAEDGPPRPVSASSARPPRRGQSRPRRSPEVVMVSVVGIGLGLAAVVGLGLHWSAPGSAPDRSATLVVSPPATAAPQAIGRGLAGGPVQWPIEMQVQAMAHPMGLAESEPPPSEWRSERPDGRGVESSLASEATPEPVSVPVPVLSAAAAVTVTASAPNPADVNRLRNRLIMAIDSQDNAGIEAALSELGDKLGQDSVFYQRMKAFAWLRLQQWAEAEQAYDSLLLQYGDDAEARFNSGRLALRRGDLDKAEQRLRPLQRHPEYRQAVAALLAELDRHQRHAQAVR